MNLWMQIMVITMLGVITISSQAEDNPLVIPEGEHGSRAVSKQKLAKAIADKLEDVSIVSDLSFSPEGHGYEFTVNVRRLGPANFCGATSIFTASFTVTTHSGAVHRDIQCSAKIRNQRNLFLICTQKRNLLLEDCKNDQFTLLNSSLSIPMDSISIEGTTDQRYIR